jgi:hypothetical protein
LDLQKENEDRLWQDGILRHVPVVSTFVNWWSPITKETGVRGRSLNLTQGVVESTENIYKYHMQMPSTGAPAGTKSPPTPLVQTPVGGNHSRSSSHASSQSGNVQTQQSRPEMTSVADVQIVEHVTTNQENSNNMGVVAIQVETNQNPSTER